MYTTRLSGCCMPPPGLGNWADDLSKVIEATTVGTQRVVNTVYRPSLDDLAQRAGIEAVNVTPLLVVGGLLALAVFSSRRR